MAQTQKEVNLRFYAAHPKYGMDKYRERRYGVTPSAFAAMKEAQNNLCAICHRPETTFRKGVRKELAIDHDRCTGQIRKLLCMRCNTSLGSAEDNSSRLKQMAQYLREFGR